MLHEGFVCCMRVLCVVCKWKRRVLYVAWGCCVLHEGVVCCVYLEKGGVVCCMRVLCVA